MKSLYTSSPMELDLWPYVDQAFNYQLGLISDALLDLERLVSPDNITRRALQRFTDRMERPDDYKMIEQFILGVEQSLETAKITLRDINPNVDGPRTKKGGMV